MYRILVVDDSEVERDCVLFLIKKYRLPLEARTAPNGCEAARLLEAEHYDILFTDVKMPFMDGLALSEAALKTTPEIRIVIFSGYHEFAYAKTAIRLGVSEYLLKPIDPGEFLAVMRQQIDGLDEEARGRELMALRLDYVKRHLLLLLINSVPEEELAKGRDAPIPLDFLGEYCCLLLLEFRQDFFSGPGVDFEEYLRKRLDLPFDYLNVSPNQSLAFLKTGVTALEEGALLALLQDLIGAVEADYGQTLYAAFSGGLEGHRIAQTYRELEELMEERFFFPNRRVFYPHMERAAGASHNDPISLEMITDDIRLRDYPALREHIAYVFSSLRGAPDYSELYIKFLFSSVVKEIMDQLPGDRKGSLAASVEKLYLGDDIGQLEEMVRGAVDLLEDSVPAPSLHASRAETVKEYIHRHYASDLSLERLAREVYVHPDYLCRIFKKETGQTLNRYIKGLRMEKAKELLQGSPMKIRSICQAVGYQNFSYFCQSFRDYYGTSPEKMRQQTGGAP